MSSLWNILDRLIIHHVSLLVKKQDKNMALITNEKENN